MARLPQAGQRAVLSVLGLEFLGAEDGVGGVSDGHVGVAHVAVSYTHLDVYKRQML